jgi:hypothetical protein
MMKRVVIVLLVGLCIAAVTLAAQEQKYGTGVALKEATTIRNLLAQPDRYLGKTVRVDGTITAVCDMAGCWMELADPNSDPTAAKTLRFKVDDGVIVFPVSAKGKRASAEGVFEKVSGEMAGEYAADAQKAKGGDMKTAVPSYQVKATGAVIY